MANKFLGIICILGIMVGSLLLPAFSQEPQQEQAAPQVTPPAPEQQQPAQPPVAEMKEPEYIGELLDTKVPRENYIFIKTVYMIFGDQGAPAKTEAEKEEKIWDDLVLSYEAFRRGIAVSQEEVDEEVKKILDADKVAFNFKGDRQAYSAWVKDKTNEPLELFENQLRHLVQMRKLRQQVMDAITPEVSDKDAHQRFLDESSSLSVELAEFEKKEDAEAFYKQARQDKKIWEAEKAKRPDAFRQPGFVTLAFLMDIWKFPRDAAYKMVKMKKGAIYGPEPIYKGYAVFQVLDNRPADESEYPKAKDGFYEKIKSGKKYEGMEQWFKDLKKQADIKIYNNGEKGDASVFPKGS